MYTVQVLLLCSFGVYLGWGLPPREQTNESLGIIGGNVTDITKTPYQAAVLIGSKLICGASIISKNFLLTACHCCAYDVKYTARVGSNYWENGGTLLEITHRYVHPECEEQGIGLVYDVCLLKTSSDIEFGEKVKPVPISYKIPQPNDLSLVAGWGKTQEVGPVSDVLESVQVPVTNKSYCADSYGDLVQSRMFICAGVEGKDSCQGDSGGGLVWKDSLVGVVSFGYGCGEKDYPGVYTNVVIPEIRDFIRDTTGV